MRASSPSDPPAATVRRVWAWLCDDRGCYRFVTDFPIMRPPLIPVAGPTRMRRKPWT